MQGQNTAVDTSCKCTLFGSHLPVTAEKYHDIENICSKCTYPYFK